jgi:hypothetical protein
MLRDEKGDTGGSNSSWTLVFGGRNLSTFSGDRRTDDLPVTTRGVIEPTSNLQYRLGGVLMIAGVVTLGGLLVVEVRNRKGGKL